MEGALFLDHRVADVGPVEARNEDLRVAKLESEKDVLARLTVGGRGEGDEGHAGELRRKRAQLHVFRAEVVAPLRDAMSFVDREAGNGDLAQPSLEIGGHQAFGRNVK